jgi:hypothetical protein
MLQARFLSYHATLHRRLGRVGEVRGLAERACAIAETYDMLDYVGVAHANLCWVALRSCQAVDVERHGRLALSAWDKLRPAYAYPMQWLARMPLAAHCVDKGHVDVAVDHWRALLESDQCRLGKSLEDAIQCVLGEAEPPARADKARRVVDISKELRLV